MGFFVWKCTGQGPGRKQMAYKFTEGTFTLVRAGRNVQSVEGKAFLLGLKGQERKELVRGARRVAAGGSHPRADKAFGRSVARATLSPAGRGWVAASLLSSCRPLSCRRRLPLASPYESQRPDGPVGAGHQDAVQWGGGQRVDLDGHVWRWPFSASASLEG